MLNSNHITDINKKGYTIIKSFFNEKKLKYWYKYYDSLEKKVLTCTQEFLNNSTAHVDIEFTPTGERYMERIQHVIDNTTVGKNFIEDNLSLIQQIEPKALFLKDRYINQRGMSKYCSLPHQDAFTGGLQDIGTNIYTLYIALTDVDENTGSLFVEDIQKKRTKSLGICDLGCGSGYSCICNPVLKVRVLSPQDIKNYTASNIVKSQHKMKAISMTAGDCILLDGCVVHGVAQNISDYNRKTMTLTYIVPSNSFVDPVIQYHIYRKKNFFGIK